MLHNQEGANAEKGGFSKDLAESFPRELSLDVLVGVHILLVVEQSSLENQSRGCAKTSILTILDHSGDEGMNAIGTQLRDPINSVLTRVWGFK